MEEKLFFPMEFFLTAEDAKKAETDSSIQPLIEPMEFFRMREPLDIPLEETSETTLLSAHEPMTQAVQTKQSNNDSEKVAVDLPKALAVTSQTLARQPALMLQYPTQSPAPLTMAAAMSALNIRGKKTGPPKPAATPYLMMKKTIEEMEIVVKDGETFRFNGFFYQKTDRLDMESIIMDVCRKEVENQGDYSKLSGAYRFMLTESQIRKLEWHDDGAGDYVTFLNGNLNVRTGYFLPGHSPNIFTTFMLSCQYLGPNCGYECPNFDRLLNRITGGDPDMTERLWQIFGYCLTPDIDAKKGFLFQGVGDSGKTKLSLYLSSFFPADRVSGLSIHDLGGRFSAAELRNVSLCVSGDLPSEELKSKTVGIIKALSGGDLLSTDVKFKAHSRFYYEGKFIMVSNHPLLTKAKDKAFENRIVAVPFNFSVPPEEQNPRLLNDLDTEKDVVASKAIDAYFRLKADHYRFAGTYVMNTSPALYEDDDFSLSQNVYRFLREKFEASFVGSIFMADAYSMYLREYPSAPYNVFAQEFIQRAKQMYGGRDVRKRRNGSGNPLSLVEGIAPRAFV